MFNKRPRNFTGRVAGVPIDITTTKNGQETAPDPDPYETIQLVQEYAEIAKDLITHAALTIGGVVAGVAIIKRICK